MSFYTNAANAALASGIEPLVFDFEEVRIFGSAKKLLRSFLVVNSLELGVLTMKQYRFVARRTAVGDAMVERHIHKLFYKLPDLMASMPEVELFTVPVYPRMLKNKSISDIIMKELAKFPAVDLSRFALEISSDILYEELDELVPELERCHELGVKLIVSEVGDPFCPVLRLKKLPFDMAFLDTAALHLSEDDPALPGSLVFMLKSLNLTPYATELCDEGLIPLAESIGCAGYSITADRDAAALADAPETFEVADE